jgi:hypothetical protein
MEISRFGGLCYNLYFRFIFCREILKFFYFYSKVLFKSASKLKKWCWNPARHVTNILITQIRNNKLLKIYNSLLTTIKISFL